MHTTSTSSLSSGRRVAPLRVRPGGSELNFDRAARRECPVLHLNAEKPKVPVADEVERRVLAECRENDEPLVGQIGDRVRDADIALVFRVMSPHNYQNTRLPERDRSTLGLRLAPVAQWTEQVTSNDKVAGSSPAGGAPFGSDPPASRIHAPLVAVAQLVRAPGCGPGGRGFESPRSPHLRVSRNSS